MNPFIMCLPVTLPPAASTRDTTVASTSGMKPSIACEVNTCGMPATLIWSLKLTVLPASNPRSPPPMAHFQSQAW